MKKIFLSLSLASGFSWAAQAQTVRYGAKIEASFAGLTDDYISTYGLGINGGVLANLAFTNHFAVQPEVLYAGKGRQGHPLYYLDVPVLAKIATGRTGLFVELGPQVSVLLAARSKFSDYSYNTTDGYHTFDFGYVGGLGFQTASGASVGLRYNRGLTSVYKPYANPNGQTYQSDAKTSAFQLYAGYMFGGK